MRTLVILIAISMSSLAYAFPTAEEQAEVNKFIAGQPGVIVNINTMGYEPHAWKLLQISPAGSAMYRHTQPLHRPFVVAVRKSPKLVQLAPGMSLYGTVNAGCLKYLGPNSYRTLQGFEKQLRVYEIVDCQ